MTDGALEGNLDCGQGHPMGPRGQTMTAWPLWFPEQAPELSVAGELGHHCGLDRELGGAGCSRVGFRQETKVGHVVEMTHVFLADSHRGL